jgi:hypothetical protein
MSSKYASAGWQKFEFPPDMITEEQNAKTMKLTASQMESMMEKRISSRIITATKTGDWVTQQEWKRFMAQSQKRRIPKLLTEEFIQDFNKWLKGQSIYNAKEFERLVWDGEVVVARKTVPGCPWGSANLFCVPGVTEYLDQGEDRRSKVIDYISKLKLRGPTTLEECWMYYKYIIREVALDDEGIKECMEYAPYDYPGGNSGPGQMQPVPGPFDENAYHQNFNALYEIAQNRRNYKHKRFHF